MSVAATLLLDMMEAVFGDPIIRDVDDDELPLPEHRLNTDHCDIYDEPEIKRIRTEKCMPKIVKDRDGKDGRQRNASFANRPTTISSSLSPSSLLKVSSSSTAVTTLTTATVPSSLPSSAKIATKRGRSASSSSADASSPSATAAKAKSTPILATSPTTSLNKKKRARRGSSSAAGDDSSDDEHPSEAWTVADLKEFANTKGIQLGNRTRKTEILEKVLKDL